MVTRTCSAEWHSAVSPNGIRQSVARSRRTGSGEALRIADIFRARPVDTTTSSFVFEVSGPTSKVDQFIALMREVGLVEVARTGVVAIARGAEAV